MKKPKKAAHCKRASVSISHLSSKKIKPHDSEHESKHFSERLERAGQFSDWTVLEWWPDLFILKQRDDGSGKPLLKVLLDTDLEARFRALSKDITNHRAGLIYNALWRLHLLELHKNEFGDFLQMLRIQTIHEDKIARLEEMEPFFLDRLEDLIKVAQLLTSALFPNLSKVVYRRGAPAKIATRDLVRHFRQALKKFGESMRSPPKKNAKRFSSSSNRQASLSWHAIVCAWNYVQQNKRLPTKLELGEQLQQALSIKNISKSTWSDALETAGLSSLPEAQKFSTHILGGKRVRKNKQFLRTTSKQGESV